MKFSRTAWGVVAAWVALVIGYAAVSLLVRPGPGLTAFGDVVQCLIPLFANACLLWNAASPYRRRNSFWMLLALGCMLWLVGQLVWTYDELVLRQNAPNPFPGDIVFFLHLVPMMAALALRPHARKVGDTLRHGYLDLLLLAVWWLYLYCFIVVPWRSAWPDVSVYHEKYLQIYTVENLILVLGLAALSLHARGSWRRVYALLFGAASLYTIGYLLTDWQSSIGAYHTGSVYDVLIVGSFAWFGTAGIVANRLSPVPDPVRAEHTDSGQWSALLATIGVLSMPVLAVWNALLSQAPQPVRQFRLLITLAFIVVGATLVFLRQHLVDRERLKLLSSLRASVENLKRLQTQFVQAEKLASLGQLAAGAAHEINNPLTAILGYSDLLVEDRSASDRARQLGEKIREQARRTKTLVTNLLSFARQVPAEKQLLDLNSVITSAVQLRNLDLRDKNIRMELQNQSVVPAVRGDPNQLLQVFYHLVSNAVDAMETVGGGVLTVSMIRERNNVAIEFSDTGPGLREPDRVFDPFYTTKPVGKGTGLGLSICYGIIQEHGGRIMGYNRQQGGTTFRIELPAVLALIPQAPAVTASPSVGAVEY